MKLFKNFFLNSRIFFVNLIHGLKNVEDSTLTAKTITIVDGDKITEEVKTNSVAKALLRGELTNEVKELRYRIYKVDDAVDGYEYFTPTLTSKKNSTNSKFYVYYKDDGLELITSQQNDFVLDSLENSLNGYNAIVGETKEHKRVNISHKHISRYNMSKYLKRIDVKKIDEKNCLIELYFSKYHIDDSTTNKMSLGEDFISKMFIKEIESIKNGNTRSEILDIDNINFITNKAYNLADLIEFNFQNIRYKDLVEFDGNYLLRFTSEFKTKQTDLVKKYYSESMEKKYRNKEKKKIELNLAEFLKKDICKCEDCGKEVVIDYDLMCALEPHKGRDITEERNNVTQINVLDFMDMQISQQTIGKSLCTNCLKKYMKL